MVLIFVMLLIALRIVGRINGIVRDVRHKYEFVQQFVMLPLRYLSSLFERERDPDQ